MAEGKNSLFRRDFDYEEDDYDRLKTMTQKTQGKNVFTNKASLRKFEFDYEEDPYEPGNHKR